MKKIIGTKIAIAALAATASFAIPQTASAQEKYLGEIFMGGWNFCPRGSASASGQLLSIAQNSALFSLLGTQFGGDGSTTFGLPDLRGRVAMNEGHGPGLSNYRVGNKGGTETNTLHVNNMPSHGHTLNGTSAAANTPNPAGGLNATTGRNSSYAVGTADAPMGGAIGSTGGNQPFANVQPYLVITYCVATQGIFPSRS